MNDNDLPAIMTVQETSRFLRLSRSATYRGIGNGTIPAIRIGRRILVPTAPLLRMVGIQHPNGNQAPRQPDDEEK